MRDIPIDDLATISPEIHAEAVRIGCPSVEITGKIWPGGELAGGPQEAARFVRYSWYQAAVIGGRAIFEAQDPAAYHELLVQYGLEEPAAAEPARLMPLPAQTVPPSPAESSPGTALLSLELPRPVLVELERQARQEGITVSELLAWRFQPRHDA